MRSAQSSFLKTEAPMDPALRLHPGQQALTAVQQAEARRFVEAYIQSQLSTEPVDEQEAEAFLRQAYQVVGLPAPASIRWLDGPLELLTLLGALSRQGRVEESLWPSIGDHLRERVEAEIAARIGESYGASLRYR